MASCLGLWTLGAPWAVARGEARARPSAFWWPWVLALAPWCDPFVTWRMRRELRRWGPRAGLSAHWRADRWLAACVLLFAYFVSKAGVGLITERIQELGAGFLLILVVSSFRYVVRALAWTRCIEPPFRLPFRDAFAARIMGDALGNVIPFVSADLKVLVNSFKLLS